MALNCDPCSCSSEYYKDEWTWRKAVVNVLCQVVAGGGGGGGGGSSATRNNGASSAFPAANLATSSIAVDANGRLYLAPDGSLPAGTNSIGNIGTVSAVTAITNALPAGANSIGNIGTVSTVTAVTAITNALPTGTNSIGKISDITTSVVPGTSATDLGKAEDAASASGDTGVFVLNTRQDTPASSTSTDGDYQAFKSNSLGASYIDSAFKAVQYVYNTLAFGSVTTTYATLLTNANKGRYLKVNNKLNTPVLLSSDGATDQIFVDAGEAYNLDLAADGLWSATNISVKSVGANAASGNIYATILY